MPNTDMHTEMGRAMEKCALTGLHTLREKVSPKHTAVLVIDMQNDFCHSDGVQSKRGVDMTQAQQMTPKLVRFLSEARKYQPFIVFIRSIDTKWSISPVWIERPMKFPEHLRPICMEKSWGADFYQVSPQEGECIVTKYRYSAFQGTDLELILRNRNVRTLIATGIATPVCVESTVRDGFMKDFYAVIVSDCTAGRSEEAHTSAISIMEKYFATVATSDEIINAWKTYGTSGK